MKKSKKNLALAALGLSTLLLGTIGVTSLRTDSKRVDAAESTPSVNALGILSWAKGTDEIAYKWSYSINGISSAVYQTEKNEVNAGIALTKAAQAAVACNTDGNQENDTDMASVTFSITPVTASGDKATVEYTYNFSSYIDYGYATHDLSEVKAQATGFTKISELSLDGSLEGWISSAMFKNDVLTLGMRADETLDVNGLDFALFGMYYGKGDDGNYHTEMGKYNYRIAQKPDGSVSVGLKTAFGGDWFATYSSEADYNLALETGKPYYLSMAVFDTFDLSGNAVGETVYYARNEYDLATDELQEVGGFTLFVGNETLTEKSITYKTTPQTLADSCHVSMEVDISGLYVSTNGFNSSTSIGSGIPAYTQKSAPTGVYYDNIDQTLNWNKVTGATEYEWKVGDGAWEKTTCRKVNLASKITDEYVVLGYLPLSVRATGGKTANYNLDLTRFYKTQSTVADYLDYCENGDPTKGGGDKYNKISFPSSLTKSYGPSGYTYVNTKNDEGEALGYGKYVTSKIKITAEAGATTRIYYVGLLGPATHKSSATYDRYYFSLYGDGTVQLGTGAAVWKETSGRLDKSKYWRMQNVTDKFRIGFTYYLTYGVDEIVEYDETLGESVVVAHRFSVRIEEQADSGLSRKLLGIVSYDNEKFNSYTTNTDGTVKTEYRIENTPSIYGKSSSSHVDTYRALGDENTNAVTINFNVAGNTVAQKTTYFGANYDFSSMSNPELPDGYDEFIGWVYTTSKGQEKDFNLQGRYDKTSTSLTLEAKMVATEYTVTYQTPCENPNTYKTDDEWLLKAPTYTPDDGTVFDAWYLTSDTSFENPLTTLKGLTGNLELVARFANKYKITVITEEGTTDYYYEIGTSDELTLVAPEVENKTFVGWLVADGDNYVAYDGETTFTPSESKIFKANYAWTEYAITYVLYNAINDNPTSYTVNDPVTFVNARKSGYFFIGWYAEAEFLTKIEDTEGCVGALTVYAKFMRNTLPNTTVKLNRSLVLQTLPIPELTADATYEVTLLKDGNVLSIVNNQYAFNEAGEYVLHYVVTLDSGEVLDYDLTYLVGDLYVVTIHYAQGKTIKLEKLAGEKILESDLPELVEGYKFGGLYVDSAYETEYNNDGISNDTNVYVKWIPVQIEPATGLFDGCGGSIAGVTSASLFALGVAAFVFLKRKN